MIKFKPTDEQEVLITELTKELMVDLINYGMPLVEVIKKAYTQGFVDAAMSCQSKRRGRK